MLQSEPGRLFADAFKSRFEPVVPANPNPVVGKIRLKQGEKEWLIRQDDRNDMMIGRNQLVRSSMRLRSLTTIPFAERVVRCSISSI